jgi:hypothetical protein
MANSVATRDAHELATIKRLFGYAPEKLEFWDRNLFYIGELIEERLSGPGKEPMGLNLAELDQIADYKMPTGSDWPPLPCGIDPDNYGIGETEIDDFLVSLQWWIHVEGWVPKQNERGDQLLRDVFAAYCDALGQPEGYDAFKTLRLYRLYTRQICKAAQETWPKANLKLLRRLV